MYVSTVWWIRVGSQVIVDHLCGKKIPLKSKSFSSNNLFVFLTVKSQSGLWFASVAFILSRKPDNWNKAARVCLAHDIFALMITRKRVRSTSRTTHWRKKAWFPPIVIHSHMKRITRSQISDKRDKRILSYHLAN